MKAVHLAEPRRLVQRSQAEAEGTGSFHEGPVPQSISEAGGAR